jgi:tetratricopeptide (TPR) repeat protein
MKRALIIAIALALGFTCACSREQRLMRDTRSAYRDGDLDAALAAATRVVRINPENHDAFYYIGLIHYSRDDYSEALEALDSAVRLDGAVTHYLLQRGDTLSHLQRYDEAIRDYEAALEIAPGNARAHYALGIAHYNRRDYLQATRWLKRYMRLTGDAVERERVRQMIEMLEQ